MFTCPQCSKELNENEDLEVYIGFIKKEGHPNLQKSGFAGVQRVKDLFKWVK